MRSGLIVAVVFIILALGVAAWMIYQPKKGLRLSKEKKTLDKAARFERPSGPETIDFRQAFWGHNIAPIIDADQNAHGHFWLQHFPYAGDYLVWTRHGQEYRYRITWVQGVGDPTDMYRFEAVPSPKENRG